ncbi:MAG: filamentous hemagglutinin family protein [Methylococcales bacterium]|nr:filamentous hemagglutinin family protein [Methylococcales bacterium]
MTIKNAKHLMTVPGSRFPLRPISAFVRFTMASTMVASVFTPVQAADANLPVPSAVWRTMGSATATVTGNQMDIVQSSDRAILNWQSFNIGKDHGVNFKQPGKNSIALNRIFQNDPSRIMGTLTANGQVYLVNSNGVVFGEKSKVDVRGLVASTLDISDDALNQGITKVFANDGSAAFNGKGNFYQKNADGSFKLDDQGNKIKIAINVEKGAQIKTTDGQNILIIAPTITNKGDISADDRQVVLAAATDKVYLQEAGNDGLLVEVKTGGEINNLGAIAAKRGNVSLVGFAVNQNGKVSASTSLNINGKIRLVAREGATAIPTADGFALQATNTKRSADIGDGLGTSATVKLGAKSVTTILPDLDGPQTAIDEQVQPKSEVNIMAHKVHLQSGSKVIVPGGKVNVVATENPSNPLQASTNSNASRILVDGGAKIDVSGIDTTIKSMESNVVAVELRLNQLKDAPLQRDGILYGKTILVDARKGTPLADIKPDVAAIKKSLGERLAKGGDINLSSEGDTIVKKNAKLDFSGGAVKYADGYITTTKLVSNGRLIDISEANPSLKYDAVYGKIVTKQKKWGVEKVWDTEGPVSLARKEAGYTEGHDAGSLTIKSPNVLLDGNLNGSTVYGRYQRTIAERPHGGSLTLDLMSASEVDQSVLFTNKLQKGAADVDLYQPFPVSDANVSLPLTLQTKLLPESGIMNLTVLAHGAVTVASGSTIKLADAGSLTLQGGVINIAGNIKGTGAKVDLTTDLNAKTQGVLSGDIILGKNAKVDLQGAWVNELLTPFDQLDNNPITLDGGSFTARANGNISLQAGSVIDVSGGARLKTDASVEAGKGGGIHLHAIAETTGSNMTLLGLLKAFALRQGGVLEVEANSVVIRRRREEEPEGLRPLQLDGDFFSKGGFADYLITSNINGLVVEQGVDIKLQQVNRILDDTVMTQASADSIAGFSTLGTLAAINRLPSSLTLEANHSINPNADSQLLVNRNATITADTLSSVKLISDSSLFFDGSITAHGGDVALQITPPQGSPTLDPLFQAKQGLWLSDHAKIDVSGIALTTTDAFGMIDGQVYDGGNVQLTAARGFVATSSGSAINASGSAEILTRQRLDDSGVHYDQVNVGSHGGSIAVTAAEGVFLAGRLKAQAGNAPGTAGGTLSVRLDSSIRAVPVNEGIILNFPTNPGILNVSQQQANFFDGGFATAGDALPSTLQRNGFVSVQQVSDGGFSELNLQSDHEIRFLGDINAKLKKGLKFDAAVFGWQRLAETDGGQVVFNTTQAALGSSLIRTAETKPTNGDGTLVINADLIELYGGASTAGFKQVDFNAKQDIRLRGTRTLFTQRDYVGEFSTYSTLNLSADQIYPTTLSNFTLSVKGDANGTIRFSGGKQQRPVLSAYSKLTVSAPFIEQDGIIKAPFGEINLVASNTVKFGANSLTSVSADGQTIPFGITEGGLEWLYPIGNQNLIVTSPQKTITIKADKILRDEGATIDLSGGGDLQAYEFIAGVGGSADVLATGKSFAVMPGYSGYAPFDPLESPAAGIALGEQVYLEAGGGLAAGYYTVLPAHYALLPGAYLVTPDTGGQTVLQGSLAVNADGATIVAGYKSTMGTNIKQQSWSGFAVEPGKIALTRSELSISHASDFFVRKANKNETPLPRLPDDAGSLTFDAKSQLDLPTVRAEAANGGLSGYVDVQADNIAVVTDKSGASGLVELFVSDLDKFQVGSLLLGGVRQIDGSTGDVKLDVRSKTVQVAENTKLAGAEIILAATDSIELKSGAEVAAVGKKSAAEQAQTLVTNGDGALLRVSAGMQADINRTGTSGLNGEIVVRENAKVTAETGSILLDSTQNLSMKGELKAGDSLNIGAESINIGEIGPSFSGSGLALDNSQLSQLQINELVLTSRGNVNVFGGLFRTDSAGVPEVDADNKALPVAFKHLVISAQGIAGFDNAGKTAALSAETLTLKNLSTPSQPLIGNGTGQLSIKADKLELAGGELSLSGFSNTLMDLTASLTGLANSKLTALGNLAINAAYVTGATGSKTTLDATGYKLEITSTNATEDPVSTGIAAQLNLLGNTVDINAPLLFNSGKVSATAITGDVNVKENALLDVSGALVKAGLSDPVQVPAGSIQLVSQQQNVTTQAGSRLLLNGDKAQMAAGSLNLSAALGQLNLAGTIDAHGGSASLGGRVAMDTSSLSSAGFSSLNQLVADAGFTGAVGLRVRNGDLTVIQSDKIVASDVNLSADQGIVTIAGTIDAQGKEGGSINLNANGKLTVESGASLKANATGELGNGGKVKLNSINGSGIEVQSGALIDVSAHGGDQGEVHLRADRLANGINVTPIAAGTIVGDADVVLEAVAHYTLSTVNLAAVNTIKKDTDAFMAAVGANTTIASTYGAGVEIAPGVEVDSASNLNLNTLVDLVDWRYGANKTPGFLTLRAGRDLSIQSSITDGFKNGVLTVTPTFTRAVTDMLEPGRSWSYTLVAGADLSAADTAAVITQSSPTFGDIKIGNDVKVRTGTGTISLFAGRDIVYGNDKSVVYTAGRPDEANRFGLPISRVASNFYVEYPIDGGDIRIEAGRNIKGVVGNQIVSDWLLKTGNWSANSTHTDERPTAWGIAIGTRVGSNVTPDYRQSVGALGGGNIKINAGGTISDLSVVIPTTGKQVGQRLNPNDPTSQTYLTNEVEINGGGNLQITTGGDLKGGMYYVDGGTANLNVGGSLAAGGFKTIGGKEINPILALGDAKFNITAGKNIAVQAMIDPMIMQQPANKKPDLTSIFFRYGDDSAVSMTALTGNIQLGNDVSGVIDMMNNQRSTAIAFVGAARDAFTVAPSSLKAYALNGDVVFNDSLIMYPSSAGQFELFAANNILTGGSGNSINVTMSDTNANLLPSVLNPATSFNDASLRLVLSGISNEPDKIYAQTPNHINDLKPVLVSTATGDILGNDPFQFIFAKQAQILAGNDVRNVSFQIQHNFDGAQSIVSAGRDFKFDIVRSPATGALVNLVQKLEVAGPGRLTVMAGRNVDLGSSEGISTTGNQTNSALADTGAAIDVLAGLAKTKFSVHDYIKNYLPNGNELSAAYTKGLSGFMQRMTGDSTLTDEQALAAFSQLSEVDQAHFNAAYLPDAIASFNTLMKEQGKKFSIAKNNFDNTTDQNTQFKYKQEMDSSQLQVLAAMEALFPGTTVLSGIDGYTVTPNGIVFKQGNDATRILTQAFNGPRNKLTTGDISMFFSKIHSTDGGDINLMAPNGGVNAGLAVNSSGAKDASQLGVVAIGKGSISSMVRDDFQVNTTRVMTLGGGDIMIGSTDGNIDAGRGAKTALAVPAPIIRFDNKGNLVVELPPAVSGSGIRANVAPDGSQGDALLFALQGIIDASEAGLGGKDVIVGATAIVGSDNIQVGGVAVGVPVASTGSLAAGMGSVSNAAASVAQSAATVAAEVTKENNEQLASAATMGNITVDVLGFGEEEN